MNPDRVQVQNWQGDSECEPWLKGTYEAAIPQWDQVLAAEQSHSDAAPPLHQARDEQQLRCILRDAEGAFQVLRWPEAIELYETIADTSPGDSVAQAGLIEAHRQRHIETAYYNGWIQFLAGRWLASIAELDRVLALDPSHSGAQDLRARACRQKEQGGVYHRAQHNIRHRRRAEAMERLEQYRALQKSCRLADSAPEQVRPETPASSL